MKGKDHINIDETMKVSEEAHNLWTEGYRAPTDSGYTGEVVTLEEYYQLPEDSNMELIRGKLYKKTAPNRKHQEILGQIFYQIMLEKDKSCKECKVYPAPFDVHIEHSDNEHPYDTCVQPDISVICNMDYLDDHGCIGAPDWIIEIVSPGNPKHDYLEKLEIYQVNGVREYWIVDPIKEIVLVYYFEAEDENTPTSIYGLTDKVPVNICRGFEVDFSFMADYS